MEWKDASGRELSIIEQLETALAETKLSVSEHDKLVKSLWLQLEKVRGGRLKSIVSPEGKQIFRPF